VAARTFPAAFYFPRSLNGGRIRRFRASLLARGHIRVLPTSSGCLSPARLGFEATAPTDPKV
jgi:hypothetical protein